MFDFCCVQGVGTFVVYKGLELLLCTRGWNFCCVQGVGTFVVYKGLELLLYTRGWNFCCVQGVGTFVVYNGLEILLHIVKFVSHTIFDRVTTTVCALALFQSNLEIKT